MADYIKRSDVIEEVNWYLNEFCECEYAFMPLRGAIKCIPSADVQPVVHGKWEEGSRQTLLGEWFFIKCSVCGYQREDDDTEHNTYFCPNCGADMRKDGGT